MSSPLSSETMMKLMAYADGELEDDERLEAEKLLASDIAALQFVEQITGAGNLVGEGYEASKTAKTVAAFDVTDAVMAKVALEKAADRAAKAERAPPSSVLSPLELARIKRQQRLKIGGTVVAALALAAAVFVYARPSETPMAKGPTTLPAPQTTTTQAQAPGTMQAQAPAPAATNGGVDVSLVESAGQNVSVFYLPTANELSTSVVVWVDETAAAGEKK